MASPDVSPYVDLTLHDVTAQEVFEAALAVVKQRMPDFAPNEANMEVVLLEALAVEVSELVFAANRLPGAIVEVLLRLYGISRDFGAPAAVNLRFTVADTIGHEIPTGTYVRLTLADGNVLDFRTDASLLIPAGSNTGQVYAVADTSTAAPNGLPAGTPVELLTSLAYVDSVVLADVPTGGRDEESAESMLERGQALLQRLVSTLVTPQHFVAAAALTPGVVRAAAADNYDPAQANEQQTVAITGGPTGGTFTLTYGGSTTAAIAYNAAAADVANALAALASIGAGNVSATGGPLPGADVVVTFQGALGTQDVATMTATGALTGGTTPAVTVTESRKGGTPPGSHPGHITVAVSGSNGDPLNQGQKDALLTDLSAQALALLAIHITDVTVTNVPVTTTVVALPGYSDADLQSAITDALTTYLNPDSWPFGRSVYRNELISVIDSVDGVDRVVSIDAPATDVALVGTAALARVGTVTVTVQAA